MGRAQAGVRGALRSVHRGRNAAPSRYSCGCAPTRYDGGVRRAKPDLGDPRAGGDDGDAERASVEATPEPKRRRQSRLRCRRRGRRRAGRARGSAHQSAKSFLAGREIYQRRFNRLLPRRLALAAAVSGRSSGGADPFSRRHQRQVVLSAQRAQVHSRLAENRAFLGRRKRKRNRLSDSRRSGFAALHRQPGDHSDSHVVEPRRRPFNSPTGTSSISIPRARRSRMWSSWQGSCNALCDDDRAAVVLQDQRAGGDCT